MNIGKTTKTTKSDGHPAYTRYPFLRMKYGAERQNMFAWLPTKTVNGNWVWLTKIVKTTYHTTRSQINNSHIGISSETVLYETPDQIAQRILSNEN